MRAFGFVERLRIGSHRIQMRAGEEGGFVVERRAEHGVCRTMVPTVDVEAQRALFLTAGATGVELV